MTHNRNLSSILFLSTNVRREAKNMMNELLQRKQIPQQWIFSIRHHRTHHPEGLVFLPVELEDALMQKISVSLSLCAFLCIHVLYVALLHRLSWLSGHTLAPSTPVTMEPGVGSNVPASFAYVFPRRVPHQPKKTKKKHHHPTCLIFSPLQSFLALPLPPPTA